MWCYGVPIELIQHLCGNERKSTTEIYCEQRWRETLWRVAIGQVQVTNTQ
jgi:hypothetical protein